MKKISPYKFLLLLPVLACSACGYGLKEVYNGIPYNSTNFVENYFHDWNKAINHNDLSNSKITESKEERILNDNDFVFTTFNSPNARECEPNWLSYSYFYDRGTPEDKTLPYGPEVCLSNIDKSFNYGVISKLFDGQMFCNGDFQNARMQIGDVTTPYSGFSVLFSKECMYSEYFMLNFKCSVVTDTNYNLQRTTTDLVLKLGFYLKNDTGYTYVPVSYQIDDVPTNSGDFLQNRDSCYVCFGFKLHNENDTENKLLDLSRLAGFSFEYEHLGDGYSDTHPDDTDIHHSVMLYEVSLPHSIWH